MRIALFGGSFDPPHWGHVLAATWAMGAGRLDQVWVLPVHHHPYRKTMAPWGVRWDLCQAAFTGLAFAQVRDDERRNPSGYTFDLVQMLMREHPGTEWFLVGGGDTVRDLHNWHRGEELATLLSVIAVPRQGYDQHPAALPAISSTTVRERLATGAPIDDLVPPRVASVIRANGLYAAPLATRGSVSPAPEV